MSVRHNWLGPSAVKARFARSFAAAGPGIPAGPRYFLPMTERIFCPDSTSTRCDDSLNSQPVLLRHVIVDTLMPGPHRRHPLGRLVEALTPMPDQTRQCLTTGSRVASPYSTPNKSPSQDPFSLSSIFNKFDNVAGEIPKFSAIFSSAPDYYEKISPRHGGILRGTLS